MSGYIYCFSHPIYPEYLYVGASTKKPAERVDELFTEALLTPFKIELAKQVPSLSGKLTSVHKLLGKIGDRVHPNRDYFKVDLESVETVFDLVDGTPWVPVEKEITESAWLALVDKVKVLVKQENPKVNELQLNQLKIKIASGLKVRYGESVEPTLEMIRELRETRDTIPV